jgi:UDP-2,3-diacylglucosamine pyrophosphatase LpxH
MKRVIDLQQDIAYVVTDLHGAWEPYERHTQNFLRLFRAHQADILIFLGDVIHGYGPTQTDYSLPILQDIMQLREALGSSQVIMLLGNHELAHIYSMPLTKGYSNFTPRFERTVVDDRASITTFLHSLPFVVRTAGGVMLTHAGAARRTANPKAAKDLMEFSHQALLDTASERIENRDVKEVIRREMGLAPEGYLLEAQRQLNITGTDDPRYLDLLRGFLATKIRPEWPLLWDFFFTQCEARLTLESYRKILERFLEAFSDEKTPQRVLVTGHINTPGGYTIIADRQLRLASWAHAIPQSSGCYLLFDVARPVERARDLLPFIHRLPGNE